MGTPFPSLHIKIIFSLFPAGNETFPPFPSQIISGNGFPVFVFYLMAKIKAQDKYGSRGAPHLFILF